MKIAFPPIINEDAEVIILGTMPSEESLRKQEYYGHKTNQFWKLIFALFRKEYTDDYTSKIRLLKENKIALWDVLNSCEGEGSADSNIKNEIPNDFNQLFTNYPKIRTIFFSSKKAEEFYNKYVRKDSRYKYYVLPSPSSANARLSFDTKLKEWQVLKEVLENKKALQ